MTFFRKGAATFSLGLAVAMASANFVAAASNVIELGRASEWRYLDDNQLAPAGWQGTDFNDAAWGKGSSPLGFGEPDVRTTVRFGGNVNAKAITTYFRH